MAEFRYVEWNSAVLSQREKTLWLKDLNSTFSKTILQKPQSSLVSINFLSVHKPAGFVTQDNRTEMGISIFWTTANSNSS